MSFYRNVVAAVAAMGLATAVFADTTASTAAPAASATQNPAATSSQPAAEAAAPMQTAENTATTTTTTTTTDAKVDLNKASVKELMAVKGMTKSKAAAIVSYRKKHGDFKSFDDLKNVKGFKKMDDTSMKSMEDQMTIG